MKTNEATWSTSKEEVLGLLNTSPSLGLSRSEAQERLHQYGPNTLTKERSTTFWGVFREEITEPMILLLLVVGVVYSIWGELRDALTIFSIIILLVFVEIFTEYRAKKAVYALRRLSPLTAPVIRDGLFQAVPATEIVSGDIIVLEVGVKVPADARLIESFGLEADESPLTGESAPVDKEDSLLPLDTPLAERRNMVFAGSAITRGRGTAVVTATGMQTELGKITGLVLEAKEPKTPLQLAMKQLSGLLVWVAVFFSVLIPGIGLLQGKPLKDMVLTGLSLSFATIPEELPIVITMVLGVGAYALSRRNVLVRRLRAAETLGSVTVIVTDKTGTLTENKMTLNRIVTDTTVKPFTGETLSPADIFLLKTGLLSSNVKHGQAGGYIGDPMEIALVVAAEQAGISGQQLQEGYHLQKEFSFDNQRKLMSVTYQTGEGGFVFVKGAPEAVLERSSRIAHGTREEAKTRTDEEAVKAQVESMASEAMRLIAFAYKKAPDASKLTQEEAENDLTLIGLAGFADRPRAGVREAVKTITEAGIRTVVVSGDHPLTVEKVAAEVGIPNPQKPVTGTQLALMEEKDLKNTVSRDSLFARASAEQKLKIVSILREQGEVVAVTGDGINDAPALKSADIGIAMGETGTEVARETADMVLTDDSFISVAAGVREGRKIFDNLKKGITYYLCVKVALVLSFLVALTLSIPFPFAPIQIIVLELFMDLAASATFVAEPIAKDAMKRRPPNPKERFVDRIMLQKIAIGSISLAVAVIFNYLLAWYSGWELLQAQTLAFATWLIGHVFLALNMRSERQPLSEIGLFSNRAMSLWALAVVAFLILVTGLPLVQTSLKLTSLGLNGWLLALGVPFVTIFWMELKKVLAPKHED